MRVLKAFLLLMVSAVLLLGAGLLLLESPVKTLENLAIRNADKLPLAYFGEKLFVQHCASCHDNPAAHAPTREALAGFSLESIMIAMGFGKMQPMAAHLGKREQFLIATFLSGSSEEQDGWIADHRCGGPAGDDSTLFVADWGLGAQNQRYASAQATAINRGNVASLELAWSLAFPKVSDMRSQPAVIGDTLYLGDKTGRFYAIDRVHGCVRNHTRLLSGIRSAITVVKLPNGKQQLVFADSMASIYAIDPDSLEVLWQQQARLYDTSIITGSISHHEGRLFVPVSSYEAAVSGSPSYVCCKSHGGVIALDASNGKKLWQWHATPEAELQGSNSAGGESWGPSGASVWSTPAVDAKRRRIYVGTAQNLSRPATDTSDAVIALDMETGAVAWKFQATTDDVWNAACLSGGPNCPANPGGDFDFGASIILAETGNGGDLLLAGQKSGDVYALSAEPAGGAGEVIWQRRVSNVAQGDNLARSTTNGGVHWGMSLSGKRLIVPTADPERERAGYTPRPGLRALDLASGDLLWEQLVERGCDIDDANRLLVGLENDRAGNAPDLNTQYQCSFYYGLSAASTTTDELAFSAGLNGIIRAYDIRSGDILWQAETARPFIGDNGIEGHGGAIDVSGQVIAGEWLYVQSGYSMFGQLPGNMLLAYRVTANDNGPRDSGPTSRQ